MLGVVHDDRPGLLDRLHAVVTLVVVAGLPELAGLGVHVREHRGRRSAELGLGREALLDERGERLLTRRESVEEPPNLWQRDLVRRIALNPDFYTVPAAETQKADAQK